MPDNTQQQAKEDTIAAANALLGNAELATYEDLLALLSESLLVLRVSQVKGAGQYVDKVDDVFRRLK